VLSLARLISANIQVERTADWRWKYENMSQLEGYVERVEAMTSSLWAEAINKHFGLVDSSRRQRAEAMSSNFFSTPGT